MKSAWLFAVHIALCFPLIASCSQTGANREVTATSLSVKVAASDSSGKIQVIALHTGQSFRFKGLAIDAKKETAYLGSWDKKQIVAVSLNKKQHRIIETPYSGKLNAMGVYLKGDTLYGVMNEVNDNATATPVSALVVISANTGKFLHSYEARSSGGRHHFNHVVVDGKGRAYISNTLKSAIYTVDTTNPRDTLTKLIVHPDLSWVHGIDLSPDGRKLFTTSYHAGIKILDLISKSFSAFRDTTTNANDGLTYYRGYLYGIGRNALKKYTLNNEQTAVVQTELILKDHPRFNDPRCLHVAGGVLYCLANIGFEIVRFDTSSPVPDSRPDFTDTYIIALQL